MRERIYFNFKKNLMVFMDNVKLLGSLFVWNFINESLYLELHINI